MNAIRGPTGPQVGHLPEQRSQPQVDEQAKTKNIRSSASQPATDDGSERIRKAAQQTYATEGLKAPPPPKAQLRNENVEGARSFVSQLDGIGQRGGGRASSERMMLDFLKLQILESNRGNLEQRLAGAGRSTLMSAAHASQQAATSAWAAADAAYAQAAQYQSQALAAQSRGDEILGNADVSSLEVQMLYGQSMAAGKGGGDVATRYASSHPNDPDLQSKLAAIDAAVPHYQQAAASNAQAQAAMPHPENHTSSFVMGAYATMMVRAGTDGMQSMLRNAEAQQKLSNELMNMLGGMRPDTRGRSEGWQEMDASRREVAKSMIELLDKNTDLQSSRLNAMRP